ncbi:MAG: TonB-dependent receptor plug domain-containing protein [Candidatus Latescibacteria bacterium]|nr:TonB-dependent receptor plug domain-containing protein [Candidatus Latescibacterota bacterium]
MSTRHALLAALVAASACTMGASAEEETDERKIYEVEEITVTGSRIKSAETLAPAPIVVLSAEEIRAQGLASLGDVLQTLTVQSNAINTQANNGGDGSTRVSLRGLGSNRTLVLVNGRRFVPGGTGANSSVDLNAIPASVIERIEVLKDGASAVYGSDAIGGVVNIITKTAIEGIEIDYYAGTAGAGDGEVLDLSVTTGLQSEKGHIAFSAGYHNQRPVWTGDRSFSESDKAYDWEKNDGSYNNNGSSATPEGHIIDRSGEEGNEAWQAVVEAAGDEVGDYHRDPNVGWRPFNWAGISSDGSGDTYNYQPENYLYTPQTRYSSFLSGSHTVAEDAEAYFEVVYTNRQSDQKLAPTPLFTITDGIVVSATNRYNEFGRDFIDVRRRFVEAGNRNFLQDIDTYRMVLGLDHRLGSFDGDLSFSYGRSEGTNVNEGRFILSHVKNALGRLRPAGPPPRPRHHHRGDAELHPVHRHRPRLFPAADPAVESDWGSGALACRSARRGGRSLVALGGGGLSPRSHDRIGKYHWQQSVSHRGLVLGQGAVRRNPTADLRSRSRQPRCNGRRTRLRLRHLRRGLHL